MPKTQEAMKKIKLARKEIEQHDRKIAELGGRKQQIFERLGTYGIETVQQCEDRIETLVTQIENENTRLNGLMVKLDEQIA